MKTTEMTRMAGMSNNMTATAEDRGDIRESMARMDLRNPQHKRDRDATYEKEALSPVTLKETDISKSLDELMRNRTNLIMDPLPREVLWEELAMLFKTLGPNATERMETMFPDTAIEESDLPGVYFQNDNETVSFVERPRLQDKKNFLNYVLAPVAATNVMKSLKACPQAQKDRMTVREREAYRTLMLTLRRGFADYLNPAATYVDELKSWRERGGKINKAKVMRV